MHSRTEHKSILKFINVNFLILVVFSFILINNITLDSVQAQKKKKPESPKRVLVVKDYKWSSGGMGRPAIMSEITIENRGEGRTTIKILQLKLISTHQTISRSAPLDQPLEKYYLQRVRKLFIT